MCYLDTIIGEEEFTPTHNTRLTDQPISMDANSWKITFELKLDGSNVKEYENIFRFTNTDQDTKECGDRMPAIWRTAGTVVQKTGDP